MDPLGLLWIILILISFQPIVQQLVLAGRRQQSLARLARARGATVVTLIHRKLPPERSAEVARRLTTGTWTHDRPLSPAELAEMGLSVRVGVEEDERELLKLYPARRRSSQVEYAPGSAPSRWRDRPGGRRRLN